MLPRVGKSGALITCVSRSIGVWGSSTSITSPSTTSERLCGGMLVAIPTAMPAEPFTRRFGTRVGRTVGSCSDSSKLGAKSTVRSEEHTSELQSPCNLVCRLLLEKKKVTTKTANNREDILDLT